MSRKDPLDRCMLFMPSLMWGGKEGEYKVHGVFGWLECNSSQNAFLHANIESHYPAHEITNDPEKKHLLKAVGAFVVPGFLKRGENQRCCPKCLLPGHSLKTCPNPEALDLVDPSEVVAAA